MIVLFELLVEAPIAAGFVGVAAFRAPQFARKGGRLHVRAGRVYTCCACVVTLSSVIGRASGPAT